VCFALSALIFPLFSPAEAQQGRKIPRIGYLSSRDRGSDAERSKAVRAGLRELGYIEGKNILIEYRYVDGKREQFPELAAELVHLKLDLIVVAGGTPSVREAMKATRTIPLIMSGGGADPVETLWFKAWPTLAAMSPASLILAGNWGRETRRDAD
jgi:putative tryptophan/tyrosine transport system substrate-binding protein